jgi:hypothetical protein
VTSLIAQLRCSLRRSCMVTRCTLGSRYRVMPYNATPLTQFVIGPYSLSGRTHYRARLNLTIRAEKRSDDELYTKEQFGPITRPECTVIRSFQSRFKNLNPSSRCQFHQNYTHEFFVQMCFRQLFLRTRNVHVTRKKAAKTTFVRKKR